MEVEKMSLIQSPSEELSTPPRIRSEQLNEFSGTCYKRKSLYPKIQTVSG